MYPRSPAHPGWWALAALVALALVAAWHGPALLGEDVLTDEAYYLAAAAAVDQGRPLSSVQGWFYPAPAAHLLNALFAFGPRPGLLLLRALNTLGMVAVFVLAGVTVADGLRRHAWAPLLTGVLLWLWPTSQLFVHGNVSGILFLPLLMAMRSRHAAARALWLSLPAIGKPYALGTILTRSPREAVLPLLLTLAMAATTTPVGDLSAFEPLRHGANLSPWHWAVGMLHLPWVLVLGLPALLATTWGRGSYGRGLCLGWALLPAAWAHSSAILVVPLAFALRRWLPRPPSPGRTAALVALLLATEAIRGAVPWRLLTRLPLSPFGLGLAKACIPTLGVATIAVLVADPPWLRTRAQAG